MPSVNPNTWKSLNLTKKDQLSVFQTQLPQYLQEGFSTGNLAQILNGNGGGAVPGTAINTKQVTLTGVSTNQTVNCAGALHVAITMTFSAALTLTLTNLQIGASVLLDVTNTTGGGLTLTMAATAPGGTPYIVIKGNTSGGTKNFLAGATIGAGNEFIFSGQSTTGPSLVMVGN
jgi:hypothetical protein